MRLSVSNVKRTENISLNRNIDHTKSFGMNVIVSSVFQILSGWLFDARVMYRLQKHIAVKILNESSI